MLSPPSRPNTNASWRTRLIWTACSPGARGVPQAYVDALLRELAKNTRRPDTLYFGGGTPALLSAGQVSTLIQAADPLPGAEITLEANPDVVTPETLLAFGRPG